MQAPHHSIFYRSDALPVFIYYSVFNIVHIRLLSVKYFLLTYLSVVHLSGCRSSRPLSVHPRVTLTTWNIFWSIAVMCDCATMLLASCTSLMLWTTFSQTSVLRRTFVTRLFTISLSLLNVDIFFIIKAGTGVNHGKRGSKFPEFGVGDANANCSPDFQKILLSIHQNAISSSEPHSLPQPSLLDSLVRPTEFPPD